MEILYLNIIMLLRFLWNEENEYLKENILKDLKSVNWENIVFDKKFIFLLMLKNNNICDLRNFVFNGNLLILDLFCNGFWYINEIIFIGFMELECLNLRNNLLNIILSNLFKLL